MSKFTIIIDTREQKPFTFEANEYCKASVIDTVKYGDYSIKGLEDKIFLERKASVGELAKNITEKRFTKLLDNVAADPNIKYKQIVCGFDYLDVENYPFSLKLPPRIRSKIRIRPPFIKAFISSIPMKWGIPIMFFPFEEMAREFTFNCLKQIWRLENSV